MSKLGNIEKLVQQYGPRMEQILGIEIGEVKVREGPIPDRAFDPEWIMMVYPDQKDTLYANLKKLRNTKREFPEIEKEGVVHELAHILDFQNNLSILVPNPKVQKSLLEGFAEYVACEFPEIYQDEKLIRHIKDSHKKEIAYFKATGAVTEEGGRTPYIVGYLFFKKVTDNIGRGDILRVFETPPQSMEEILEPEKYLKRMAKEENRKRVMRWVYKKIWTLYKIFH